MPIPVASGFTPAPRTAAPSSNTTTTNHARTDDPELTSSAWSDFAAPTRATPNEDLDDEARDLLYRTLERPIPELPPTLRHGARGAHVEELQRLLGAAGHDPGTIDGAFGPNTRDAVLAFQRAHDLEPDAVVGPLTWSALRGTTPAPVEPTPHPPASGAPRWPFSLDTLAGTYDARDEVTATYDIGAMREDAASIWQRRYASDIRGEFRGEFDALGGRSDETYGQLFSRVGAELGVDPYALAAYSMFESHHSGRGTFNPHMLDVAGSMVAAGIAATQAQYVHGARVPGLSMSLPDDIDDAARALRASPELGVRFLAAEMKSAFARHGDLARTFPAVAYPAWGDPERSRGAYGTMAEYASRAKAVYDAFVVADLGPR